ncbi:flagellin [bacterium]|nr:flagellin [Gammaproteobacteria bacterium]MDA9188089.1 flagellin [bacterium]MDB4136974.1 flagellin [Gammaproteobacteria bacterium]MDB9982563.1 flagellin [Gammaproteobacteria bacterium]
MTVINTNIGATIARNAITTNERSMANSMERLSTGLRINSAGDDAAGHAISSRMAADIAGLDMGVRNANDAISMIQVMDGATKEITDMLVRMKELATQAASETYSNSDRTNLDAEYQALELEITRIQANTEWNGMKLLDTDAGAKSIQLGDSAVSFTFTDWSMGSGTALLDLGADGTKDLTTQVKAAAALTAIDDTITDATSEQAKFGAWMNRLAHAADNLLNVSANTDQSRSRIQDADYALETTNLARTQIIAQASTAMLAQANNMKQTVLALLD